VNNEHNKQIIKAILNGSESKINEALEIKRGNVYVIRTFLDALKVTSWRKKPNNKKIIIDESSEFGKFMLNLIKKKKNE